MKKLLFILSILLCSSAFATENHFAPKDSIGVIEKDGKMYIRHKVDPGQTLYAVGRRYNINITEIRNANQGMKDALQSGQIILVPCKTCKQSTTPKPADEPKKDIPIKDEPKNDDPKSVPAEQPDQEFHTVKSGETLYKIATLYKLSVDELKSLNNMTNNEISAGQQLRVKKNLTGTPSGNLNGSPKPKSDTPKDDTPKNSDNPKTTAEPPKGNEQPAVPKKKNDIPVQEQTGQVEIADDADYNLRSYAFHANIPVGTLIMVTNTENNKSMYVRITGKYVATGSSVLKVTKAVAEKLELTAGKTTIRISYIPD